MSKLKNEIGNKYNNLTVISRHINNKPMAYWNCLCDCGNKTVVAGAYLRNNDVKSCGCLRGSYMKGRKHTEETKEKISKASLKRFKNKEDHPNYGKKLLYMIGEKNPAKRPEVRKKISKALKNRLFTDEHKRKLSIIASQRIGKLGSNWKGGKCQDTRQSHDYTEWRTLVFERDSYTCQMCGQVGNILNAHHLESYRDNPELRTTLSNGITMCKKCHGNFHHQFGYGNNTKEQFKENKWLED